MSIDFGFSFYFLDGFVKSPLDAFFINVQEKINIRERHARTTVMLYQSEFKTRLLEVRNDFNLAMKDANVVYEKAYNEIVGNDYEKHSYGMNESGIPEIEHHYQVQEEEIKRSFSELADHFNKSSLVLLYALLESELRRLCGRVAKEFNLRVSLDRFEKDDYLKSILDYLDMIAGLNIVKLHPYLNNFKKLQYLRNKIMHNGAEFSLEKNNELEDILNSNPGVLFLESIPEEASRVLRVKSKFLEPFYKLIPDFFYETFWVIDEKLGFVMLGNRLRYLYGFLHKKVNVTFSEQKNIKNGKQLVFKVESNEFEKLFLFNCKLGIINSKANSVEIINQVDGLPDLDRLLSKIEARNELLFQDIFNGFLKPNVPSRISFMLYVEE